VLNAVAGYHKDVVPCGHRQNVCKSTLIPDPHRQTHRQADTDIQTGKEREMKTSLQTDRVLLTGCVSTCCVGDELSKRRRSSLDEPPDLLYIQQDISDDPET